jgi:hypothetical protein
MNSSQGGSTHARSSEPLPSLSVYAILAGIQIVKTTLREYGGGNNGRLIDWSFGYDIRNRRRDCGLLLTRAVLFDAVEPILWVLSPPLLTKLRSSSSRGDHPVAHLKDEVIQPSR